MRLAVHLANAVRPFQPTDRQLAWLEARASEHTFVRADGEAHLLELLPGVDAAIVWRFEREWYARSTRLRHVLTPAAGREGVASDPSGAVTAHYGTFHGHIMAESVLAMVSFMNRRLGNAVYAQSAKAWDRTIYETTRPLRGQSVIIVGYGYIGRHIGRLLAGVGMRISGLKRDVMHGTTGLDAVFSPTAIVEAVQEADHVVCVLPGDTGTQNIIGRRVFEAMQPTACFYNLGRGQAVDSDALLWALGSGRVAGAFLDVAPIEPLPDDSPMWRTPNLFITPHASAIREDYLDLYLEEVARWLDRLD